MPKKSQDGQELFDMAKFPDVYGGSAGRRRGSWLNPSISNPKAILLVLIAGAVVYYFAIHRRK